MRRLNKKQRQLLTEWYKYNKSNIDFNFDIRVSDHGLYMKLLTIHDYGTITQDINQFLSDMKRDEVVSRAVDSYMSSMIV